MAATNTSQVSEPSNKRRRVVSTQSEGSEDNSAIYRKRTPRACDRCRLKKAKCSGGTICAKCRHDGVVCVTTLAPRRDEHIPRPGYIRLIESQRDQLAQALQKVLETHGTSDMAEMRKLLADMGVAIDNYDFTNSLLKNSNSGNSTDVLSPAHTTSPSWDDVFNNLDEPQLEVMESVSMRATPPVPGLSTEISFGSPNLDDSPSAGWNTGASEPPSSDLELTEYLQMYDFEGGAMSSNSLLDGEAEYDPTRYLKW